MKTPIIDFVNQYKNENKIRLHMPGHKGKSILGCEGMDITEIDGADSLYFADGIIKESEKNASLLFESDTYYSTEGSSLCIRAMLFLAMTKEKRRNRPVCLVARNVHKTFVTAAALLDFDCKWVYSKDHESYHTCRLTAADIEGALNEMDELPFAVYLTSPDYLGYVSDIEKIAKVCKTYDVPLLVDNAHGAYLKQLSLHPMDLGATMCCDSAHKTYPALTGAAYLHISNEADEYYHIHAKSALGMFASTSPSYLILESLDYVNAYLEDKKDAYASFCEYISNLKNTLMENGYTIMGTEPMKIAIDAKAYGYTGHEMNSYLESKNIISEFHDMDFLVLMPALENTKEEMDYTLRCLLDLPKKASLDRNTFILERKKNIFSIREASFGKREKIKVSDALGRILADTAVTCPPAVPIVVCGERITREDIKMFEYYGIYECSVVVE